MNETQLSDLLRNLPREEASADFTDRVLEQTSYPRHLKAKLWAIAASLILLALAFWTVRERQHQYEKQETLAQLEQLRAEHAALEQELARLLEWRDGRPVIVLGGDEQVEVVVGVDQILPGRATAAQSVSFLDL